MKIATRIWTSVFEREFEPHHPRDSIKHYYAGVKDGLRACAWSQPEGEFVRGARLDATLSEIDAIEREALRRWDALYAHSLNEFKLS